MGNQAANVLGILTLFMSLTLGITLIYYGHQFYKRREEMILIKRHANAVLMYTFCAIICLLFGHPLVLYTHWVWDITPNPGSTSFIIADLFNDWLYIPFYFIGCSLTIYRCWMLYYDVNFTNSCQNLEWKQCITSDMQSLRKETWFIQNKRTYGNAKYMLKRVVSVTFCLVILYMINTTLFTLNVTELELFHIIISIFFPSTLIFMVVINNKMPRFNDHIYVYKEFRIISMIYFLCNLSYIIGGITSIFTGFTPTLLFIGGFFTIGGAFALPFVSTWWVLKHIEVSVEDLLAETQKVELTMNDVLSDEVILHEFMQHLISEYSMECLLALIEFHQFRRYIIEKNCISEEDAECDVDITLTDTVPKSDIVFGDNHMIETDDGNTKDMMILYKNMAHGLYNKYIKEGGEFEINISYHTRNELEELLDDKEKLSLNKELKAVDVMRLFDVAMVEMIKLLSHSKYRFKYQKI